MVKVMQKDPSTTLPRQNSGQVGASNKELYQCEECGFHYENREWAEKCEAWCREHKSCNIEITAHAEENKTK